MLCSSGGAWSFFRRFVGEIMAETQSTTRRHAGFRPYFCTVETQREKQLAATNGKLRAKSKARVRTLTGQSLEHNCPTKDVIQPHARRFSHMQRITSRHNEILKLPTLGFRGHEPKTQEDSPCVHTPSGQGRQLTDCPLNVLNEPKVKSGYRKT